MRSLINKQNLKRLVVLLFVMAVVFWLAYLGAAGDTDTVTKAGARAFTLILWSILLEALPFVLLGTLISSLIQLYVSEETILKILPKRKSLQLVFAALLGLLFPVCECAIIPITRGLVKKGLPIGPAMAFMVAVPIINPIVIFSTYSAFPAVPEMALWRALLGFVAALLIGFLLDRKDGKSLIREKINAPVCGCGHNHGEEHACCGHSHDHSHDEGGHTCYGHDHAPQGKKRFSQVITDILAHTGEELKSVGAYLIFGAGIAASMQMFVPRTMLMQVGQGRVSGVLVMMLLAFVLSLCSEADAFVASTFMTAFSGASVLAFLLTGPMIDIKNTMMLFGSFKKRFATKTIAVILFVCFVLSMAAAVLWGVIYE